MINYLFFYLFSFLIFNFIPYSKINMENYSNPVKIWETDFFHESLRTLDDLEISAKSSVILDLSSGEYIFEKNSEEVLPIASISKFMSALVLMEENLNLDDYYKVKKEDRRIGGRDYLFFGEEVQVRDLLALSLIASDNTAVIALISYLGLSENEFVIKMNNKAENLNLINTYFEDATGLSNKNISTAKEVSRILLEVLNHKEVSEFSRLYEYSFKTKNGREKEIFSTNELLSGFRNSDIKSKVIAGKTGYNLLAGYCLAIKFSLENGHEFVSVVLNSSSIKNRFIDSENIIKKVEKIYQ